MGKQVRNLSPGIRFVNVRNPDNPEGEAQLVAIPPGRTVELEPFNENDPAYKGLIECGDLDVDGGRTKQISALQDEKKKIEEELREAHAKIAAQEDDLHAKRVSTDPNQVERRQLAMVAGDPGKATEILADRTPVDSRGDVGGKASPPKGPPVPPQPQPRGRG